MIGADSDWKKRFERSWSIPAFERVRDRVRALSRGDRVLFYALSMLVAVASLSGLYALERSLLVEVPAHGGTLTEGVLGSPQFINPLLAMSDADRDLSALTYAGLMGLSGSGTFVPVLAERYEVSADGKSYTFYLRKEAVFSDGTPATAEDVVFTVRKAQDPALKSPEYANWSGVGVEALGEQVVRFTLAKPYAPFLSLTTLGILPERLWRNVSPSEFPFSPRQMNPIGAGPFSVANISRDASGLVRSVSLAANPRYALGRPYLDGINFKFYSRGNGLRDALMSGAVDSAYDIPAGDPLTAPYARVFGVFFNASEKQAFARAEVRKALSYALDREAIVSDVLGGYATAIMGPVPPSGAVDHTPVPALDDPTESAAEILRAGGWAYDGSARIWKQASAKQTLESITVRTSNIPELKSVASAVKTDWEKLGIKVAIELYEPGDFSQKVIRPRNYEALLYGMVIGRDQDLYAFWDSKERNDPGLNIALYANKTVDALLESARSSGDAALRLDYLRKIERAVAADYPAAFIYAPNFIYAVPADLRGVDLPQITVPADRFAEVASWYKTTDAVWPFFAKVSD